MLDPSEKFVVLADDDLALLGFEPMVAPCNERIISPDIGDQVTAANDQRLASEPAELCMRPTLGRSPAEAILRSRLELQQHVGLPTRDCDRAIEAMFECRGDPRGFDRNLESQRVLLVTARPCSFARRPNRASDVDHLTAIHRHLAPHGIAEIDEDELRSIRIPDHSDHAVGYLIHGSELRSGQVGERVLVEFIAHDDFGQQSVVVQVFAELECIDCQFGTHSTGDDALLFV